MKTPKEMAEVFNRHFHSVFTKENKFRKERIKLKNGNGLKGVVTSPEEIKNSLEELDVRKATRPDGVLNWILK